MRLDAPLSCKSEYIMGRGFVALSVTCKALFLNCYLASMNLPVSVSNAMTRTTANTPLDLMKSSMLDTLSRGLTKRSDKQTPKLSLI